MVNSSTATPGRPSSVSSGDSVRSMPASAPQAITEVAKPVMVRAAISAHSSDGAVMMIRVPTMGKASAKVSTMVTPLIFSSAMGKSGLRTSRAALNRWERRTGRTGAIAAHH